jgi:hypothetical protein
MPVTIGTLTSNVNVSDGAGAITEETLERVVQAVLARMRERKETEESVREEREIPARASD